MATTTGTPITVTVRAPVAPPPAGLFEKLSRLVTYAYLLRVPIVTLAALAASPFAMLYLFPQLLENMLLQLSTRDVFIVAGLAFLTAATAITTVSLTLLHGDERLKDHKVHLRQFFGAPVWLLAFTAGPLVAMAGIYADGDGWAWINHALAVFGGLLAAVMLILAANALQMTLARSSETGMGPLLVFPADRIPGMRSLLVALYTAPSLLNWGPVRTVARWFTRPVLRLPRWIGEGYLQYPPEGRAERVYPGHAFATWLCLVSLACYAIASGAKGRALGQTTVFPTLAYLLLLLLLACWTFGALTFFLDRYRVPVLTTFAVLCTFTAFAPRTDHFFATLERNESGAIHPAAAIARRGQANVILVAAAGGGIQAAGWTTQVLTGLEEGIDGGRFGRAVRLVSGVSGGAVGAMYFANAFRNAEPPSRQDLDEARKAAMASSLDEVAWGLVGPDLRRAVFPLGRGLLVDRGWALERAFQSRAGLGEIRMSEWEERVIQGIQPAVIFSSTVVETGGPLLFSTTAYPPGEGVGAGEPRMFRFRQIFGRDRDITVATAARLSATFPIVSPAARPIGGGPEKPDWHMVDGGYYDNFGMTPLMGWLDAALVGGAAGQPVKRVLILEILPFPPEKENAPQSQRGWAFQFQAPLDALLNVRTTAQHARNDEQLHLLQDLWRCAGPDERVEIQTLQLQFRTPDDEDCRDNAPPLSWRLRTSQKRCIDKAWRAIEYDTIAQVSQFLNQP